MNKGQLVDKIAEDAGLTKKQAAAALEAVVSAVKGALTDGDKVSLVGFGTWSSVHRPERMGVDPQNPKGPKRQYPAKNVVKFKPGKDLEGAVN
ncbi:MAG: HU family DNA-binding protein [Chitinophagales bacterium]